MKTILGLLTALALVMLRSPADAQITDVHRYTNLDLEIPDGNPTGVADARTVASEVVVLSSVRLKLTTAGEFTGDLYAYLRHVQDGQINFSVLLNRSGRTASNPAGYADTGFDILFDDAATGRDIHLYREVTNLAEGMALTGVWQPDGRSVDPGVVLDTTPRTAWLDSFAGTEADGEWTLFLADLDSGGTNLLVAWELELSGLARPVVSWPTPSDLVFGAPLGAAQLNASSSVPGSFAYDPPAGTVLAAGQQTLRVTFTPADPDSYVAVTNSAALTVKPANPIAWVSSAQNPSRPSQTATFTFAAEAATPGAAWPTGNAQLKVHGTNVGGPVVLSGGFATFAGLRLGPGLHPVTVDYAGDGNYLGTTTRLVPDQLVDTPPVARPDTIERYPTNGATVAIATLLNNDTDTDGDPLHFVSAEPVTASGGVVTRAGDWLFYTPAAGFTNTDTFSYTISDDRGVTATGQVRVNLRVDAEGFSRLTVLRPAEDGRLNLQIQGLPGRVCRVEYTEQLFPPRWQVLGEGTVNGYGMLDLIDAPPAGAARRFYRAVYP